MDNLSLNRIGIILNFIAGLCLAPEAIGVDRLERWESKIDTYLDNLRTHFHPNIESLQELFESKGWDWEHIDFKRMANCGCIFLMLPITFAIIFALIPGILYFAGDSVYQYSASHDPVAVTKIIALSLIAVLVIILLSILVLALALFFIFIGTKASVESAITSTNDLLNRFVEGIKVSFGFAFFLLFIPVIVWVDSLLSSLIQNFKGKKQVRSSLSFLGLLFFVFGTLLQLIATF